MSVRAAQGDGVGVLLGSTEPTGTVPAIGLEQHLPIEKR